MGRDLGCSWVLKCSTGQFEACVLHQLTVNTASLAGSLCRNRGSVASSHRTTVWKVAWPEKTGREVTHRLQTRQVNTVKHTHTNTRRDAGTESKLRVTAAYLPWSENSDKRQALKCSVCGWPWKHRDTDRSEETANNQDFISKACWMIQLQGIQRRYKHCDDCWILNTFPLNHINQMSAECRYVSC